MRNFFRRNLQQVMPDSPADILVDIICARIIHQAASTDSMCKRGYYETHQFWWPEKNIALSFDTKSYDRNSEAKSIDSLRHDGVEIELETEQRRRLLIAINRGNEHALQQALIDEQFANEQRAVKAIAAIMGVPSE